MKKRVRLVLLLFFICIFTSIGFPISKTTAATKLPKGTTVGGIEVGGKNLSEAQTILAEEIIKWKNDGQVVVVLANEELVIPNEKIFFDIKETMEILKKKSKRPWYDFFSKNEEVHIPFVVDIQVTKEELMHWPKAIDIDKTLAKVKEEASILGKKKIDAVVNGEANETKVIAKTKWALLTGLVLDDWLDYINGLTIEPKQKFSFNEKVMSHVSYASEEEGSFLASMLYSLLIHTNVEILERHSQRVIPSYSEPGIHVLVNDLQDQDFIVFNPNDFSYTVEAKLTDDSIMMALHSIEQKTNIHTKVDMEEINYRTIYRYSKNLSPGEEVKIQNGENGSRIIVYRIWKNSSGETIKTEQISSDYYAPVPEIILRGVPENNQSIDEKINDEETTAPSNHDQKNQDENENKQIDDQLNDHANENEEANSENTIYEKPNYVK